MGGSLLIHPCDCDSHCHIIPLEAGHLERENTTYLLNVGAGQPENNGNTNNHPPHESRVVSSLSFQLLIE